MKMIRKTISILISFLCVFSLVSTSACTKKVVVTDDYPVPEVVNTTLDFVVPSITPPDAVAAVGVFSIS